MSKKFFTTGEIATLCEVSAKTVIAWIEKNQLKAFRIGRGPRRVALEDLKTFLEEREFPNSVLEDLNATAGSL